MKERLQQSCAPVGATDAAACWNAGGDVPGPRYVLDGQRMIVGCEIQGFENAEVGLRDALWPLMVKGLMLMMPVISIKLCYIFG